MKAKVKELISKYSEKIWFCFYIISYGLFPLLTFWDFKFGAYARINGMAVGVWDTSTSFRENIFSWVIALVLAVWLLGIAVFVMSVERTSEKPHWGRAVLLIIFAVIMFSLRQDNIENYNSSLYYNEVDNDCSEYIGNDIWVGSNDPDGLDRDGDGYGCESYGG